MVLPYVLMIAFYWLFLAGVVFLTGAFSSRILITGPSGADVCIPTGDKRCLGETASLVIFYASIFALVANVVHIFFHASYMTATPPGETPSIMGVFLTKTKYGRFSVVRTVMIIVLAVLSFVTHKRGSRRAAQAGVLFSAALLITLCMSGHKGTEGYLNVPFATAVLHVITVSLWIGGLFYIRLCFPSFLKEAGAEHWQIYRILINRFSTLATWCVAVAVASGGALAFFNVPALASLIDTNYGRVLLFKVALAMMVLSLGGFNKFFVIPPMNSAGPDDWPTMNRLRGRLFGLITVEATLGMLVLLATALLAHLSPVD